MLDTETKTAIDGALKTFNEYKNTMDGLKADIQTMRVKTDAIDQAKFDKMTKDIADGVEAVQQAKAKADMAEKKALDAEQKAKELETAFNRAPSAGDTEEKSKGFRKKVNKAFNEFARSNKFGGNGQMDFSSFIEAKYHDDMEFKTLAANSDPNGGYLVLPEITGPIQEFVYESSPIRQLATVTTVGTDSLEVILDNDQFGSGWVGETDGRTSTATAVFQKVEVPVNELYANAPVTQKMLDDAMIDIEGWLTQKVAQKFARDEATAFVTGSGVAKPKGLTSYTSGTDTTQKQIEQVVTGDAANFTYDGIVSLQAKLKEDYQANAVFLIQRASIANIMQIKDGIGQPIFNMFAAMDKGNNAGMETTIMGKQIYFAADVAAISSNALAMIYGDIKRSYQIVDRTGIRILRDPFTSKPNVLFYVTKRVGGGVINFEAVKLGKIST
jgi:HK97 family phage major capsid protein